MKILSVETASQICSVAVLEDKNVIAELSINDKNTHSQKMMPLIDKILKETNLTLKDIDLFTCDKGPGSFTGIRIGVASLKAFHDVLNTPLIGVSSLKSLAYNLEDNNEYKSLLANSYICSLIDAKHDNVYYGLFKYEDNAFKAVADYKAESINNAINSIKATINSLDDNTKNNVIFIGDGTLTYKDLIEKEFNINISSSTSLHVQSSVSLGKAAYDKYRLSKTKEFNDIVPLYLKNLMQKYN